MVSPRNQDQPNKGTEGTVHGRKVTPEEVAYRDGYVQGRTQEDRLYQEELKLRQEQQRALSNSNTTTGVFFGMVLAVLAVLVGGSIWAANRTGNETTAPQPQNPALQDQPTTPQSETTIIERTIERTQEAVPSPPRVVQPDVNITLPTPQPQPEAETQQPAAPQSGEAAQPEAEAPAEPEQSQQ